MFVFHNLFLDEFEAELPRSIVEDAVVVMATGVVTMMIRELIN